MEASYYLSVWSYRVDVLLHYYMLKFSWQIIFIRRIIDSVIRRNKQNEKKGNTDSIMSGISNHSLFGHFGVVLCSIRFCFLCCYCVTQIEHVGLMYFFNCSTFSGTLIIRKRKFLNRYSPADNVLCKVLAVRPWLTLQFIYLLLVKLKLTHKLFYFLNVVPRDVNRVWVYEKATSHHHVIITYNTSRQLLATPMCLHRIITASCHNVPQPSQPRHPAESTEGSSRWQ